MRKICLCLGCFRCGDWLQCRQRIGLLCLCPKIERHAGHAAGYRACWGSLMFCYDAFRGVEWSRNKELIDGLILRVPIQRLSSCFSLLFEVNSPTVIRYMSSNKSSAEVKLVANLVTWPRKVASFSAENKKCGR